MTKVKEVMIPVDQYVTVNEGETLIGVFTALEEDRKAKADKSHAHRDVLVQDAAGKIVGKVTMLDVFKSLEPNYRDIERGVELPHPHTLSGEYVAKLFRDFNLWTEPFIDMCQQSLDQKVEEVMHTPGSSEFVAPGDELEKALHRYIMGVHQPLLVKEGDKVVGVLRFGDVFEEVRKRMLSCGT